LRETLLSQFDRRADDLFRQAEWACNRPFLAAAMAAAALVACAEGRPDAGKRRALQAALADLDTGPAVDPGAAANLFNSFANGIRSQPTLGRKAALRAVASLAGDASAAARLLVICHEIGSLGGGISARELTAIDRIAAALGAVPPALPEPPAAPGQRAESGPFRIVIGNEKGGTGKSTTAMHLAVSLLYDGHKVGCIDLDFPQSSLGRYIENRQTLNRQHELNLPVPDQVGSSGPVGGTGLLEEDLHRLASTCDFVVVDTPGSDSAISRMAHSWAGIVVTPINDSFVDLDTLAVLDSEGKQILRRGHYAEMVASARKQKLSRTGEGFDWIVLRNRLSNLEARNKNSMADALEMLSGYLDFRIGAGLSERVVYRELYLKGLTLLDLREQRAGVALSMSHVAARQELRALVQSIGISAADAAREVRAVAAS